MQHHKVVFADDHAKEGALVTPDDSHESFSAAYEDHKRRCWYFAMVCHYSSLLRGISRP